MLHSSVEHHHFAILVWMWKTQQMTKIESHLPSHAKDKTFFTWLQCNAWEKKWQRVLSWCVNVSSVAHKKLVISTCVKGSWWEHEKMNEEKTNLINFLNMCFLFSQGASLDVYMQSFKQVLSVTFFHSLCRCLSKFFTKFNFSLSKNSWKTSLGEHLIGKIEIELFLILGILLLTHSWHLW